MVLELRRSTLSKPAEENTDVGDDIVRTKSPHMRLRLNSWISEIGMFERTAIEEHSKAA